LSVGLVGLNDLLVDIDGLFEVAKRFFLIDTFLQEDA
jgi:hypothetical protein